LSYSVRKIFTRVGNVSVTYIHLVSFFIVETCMKDDKLRYLIPILRKLGAA